jgi:hypothetical protein
MIESQGADPDIVSSEGLLVTPKNVGLSLVGSVRDLKREMSVGEKTLNLLPDIDSFAGMVSPDEGFGKASVDSGSTPEDRVEHLDKLTDCFGTYYQASCLSSCGMAKFCREKLHLKGDPAVSGTSTVRFLPGVRSLDRAAELAAGASPTQSETASGAADVLADAGSLYDARTAHLPFSVDGAA